jgi:putative membrane protein
MSQPWMHAKLLLVSLLVVYHFFCGYHLKQFAKNNNQRSHVYFRIFNELPVFILIGVIILVVIKPFSA